MGACILSLFFYTPAQQGQLEGVHHSRPKTTAVDVHALVAQLQHVVVLERTELLARCV